MAHYNPLATIHDEECRKKYEELKQFIVSKDKDEKLNKWMLASEHIRNMESTLEKQEKQLEAYRSFFVLLNGLLPRRPSLHDIIG